MATRPVARLLDWIEAHPAVSVAALLLAGVAVRLAYITSCYLNPDEAMHGTFASVEWLSGALDLASTIQHPPLLVLITRIPLWFGRSELIVRLPMALLAAGTCWLTYLWVRRLWNEPAALASLIFLTGSPALLSAGTEVRQTAPLLFFLIASLYAIEIAVARQSALWVLVHAGCLGLALVSHYSAGLVAVALVLIVPLRLMGSPMRVWAAWLGTQLCGMIVGASLFISHVSGRSLPSAAFYLKSYFYQSADASPLSFATAAFFGTWQHLAGVTPWGGAAVAAFAIALLQRDRGARDRWALRLLLIVPFLIALTLAFASIYPMGDTRHVAFLLPFAAAGVGAGVAAIYRGTRAEMMVAAALLLPLWWYQAPPANRPSELPWHHMRDAKRFMRSEIPETALLVTDIQTYWMLRFYLGGSDQGSQRTFRSAPPFHINAWWVIGDWTTWVLTPEDMHGGLERAFACALPEPGQDVWIVSSGWQAIKPLTEGLPPDYYRRYQSFGEIRFMELELERLPWAKVGQCVPAL